MLSNVGGKIKVFPLTGPQFVVPTHCCHPLLSLNGSVSQERKSGKEGTQMKGGVTWKWRREQGRRGDGETGPVMS